MQLNALQCKECGANINIETNKQKIVFCSYCGTKHFIDDESLNINVNYKKEDVARVKESEHKVKIREMELAHELKASKRESKDWVRWIIVAFALMFLPTIFFSFFNSSEKKEHLAEIERLQNIVVEIEAEVVIGNYESALIKANSLHYISSYSSDTKKKWDETRKGMIKTIEQSKKDAEKEEKEAQKQAEKEAREAEKICEHCGGQISGVFSKKCKTCGKSK